MKRKLASADTVGCPYCHMPPFTHCVSNTGNKLSQFHMGRRRAVAVKVTKGQDEIRAIHKKLRLGPIVTL